MTHDSCQVILANRLARALASAGLSDTAIWAYDHNTDHPEYPQVRRCVKMKKAHRSFLAARARMLRMRGGIQRFCMLC